MVVPLITADSAVSVLVAKAGEELHEHVVNSALTGGNLGVGGAVENLLELGGRDEVLVVGVKLLEGTVNLGLADLGGSTSDASKELIEVDEAILGGVEVLEEAASFALGNVAAEVFEAPVELLLVDKSVTVGVQDGEGTAE